MGLRIEVTSPVDVARMIDGLLIAAEHVEDTAPLLAKAFTDLADLVGDALDRLPQSSDARRRAEQARRHIEEYLRSTEVLVNGRRVPKADVA